MGVAEHGEGRQGEGSASDLKQIKQERKGKGMEGHVKTVSLARNRV